jgi:hypothetical protein
MFRQIPDLFHRVWRCGKWKSRRLHIAIESREAASTSLADDGGTRALRHSANLAAARRGRRRKGVIPAADVQAGQDHHVNRHTIDDRWPVGPLAAGRRHLVAGSCLLTIRTFVRTVECTTQLYGAFHATTLALLYDASRDRLQGRVPAACSASARGLRVRRRLDDSRRKGTVEAP